MECQSLRFPSPDSDAAPLYRRTGCWEVSIMWFSIIYLAVPWGSLASILTSSNEAGFFVINAMKLQKVARG